ncbi:hypothetical protein [Actinophytocola sp.]|uniref:hypothetical protein n=1 Tax=Actinophytocola sp. TaxID=1872138 RepID=UPI003D6A9D9E
MHEVNPQVQRRQRVVKQVRCVQPVAPGEVLQPGVDLYPALLGGLTEWMEQFWAALDEDSCDVERACDLTGQLLGRVDAIKAVQRLRPWRELCQAVEDTLTSVHGVWEATLNAYAAPAPVQAQRAEQVLQGHIDAACSALDRWAGAIDRVELMVGRSPDDLAIAMVSLAMTASSATDIAMQRITRIGGPSAALPAGIGEYVRSCVEMAATLGERQSFEDIVVRARDVLRAGSQKCRDAIESDVFRNNFSRALAEMYRSGSMLHVLSTVSGNDRVGVDALMSSIHTVVESSTRHSIALFSIALTGSGYRSALSDGAAACVRRIRSTPHARLVADIDLDLRNAVAHRAYVIKTDNGVDLLNDRGNVQKHLTSAQLVDAVIAGHVTAMALTVAVVLFGVESGADVMPLLETVESLPATQSIQLVALVSGWPCPDIQVSDDQCEVHVFGVPRIELTVDMERAGSLLASVNVAARVSPGVERFVVHDDNTTEPLVIDTNLARAVANTEDPFTQVLSYLRLFHSMRRGDHVELDASMRRALILRGAQLATTEGGVAAVRMLIELRALARHCADTGAADHLTDLLGRLRAQIAGYAEPNRAQLFAYAGSERPSSTR